MKYLILLIMTLSLYTCGNGKKKQNTQEHTVSTATLPLPPASESTNTGLEAKFEKEIEIALGDQPTEKELHEALSILNGWYADKIDDADAKITLIKQKLDSLNGYNFNSKPYTSIQEIDNELYSLYDDLMQARFYEDSYARERFTDRFEFHLTNPLTFHNKLPRTDSFVELNIISSPDGKCKFYCFDNTSGGVAISNYSTYVQSIDDSGNVVFYPWQENRKFGSNTYLTLWQFTSNDTTYYVAKSARYYWGASLSYYMEIFSLSNGIPTLHTEFYPEGIYEPSTISMLDGEQEYDAPCYDVCVIERENFGDESDYTFDPKTKTVHITEYFGTVGDGNKLENIKREEKSWQLVNVE